MSDFKPGDKVIVRIGGERLPGTFSHYYEGSRDRVWVEHEKWGGHCPADWVEPVTPPCPWTELGTIVRIKHGDIYELADRGWFVVGDGRVVDYDSTIAPFNPVRLIPEQPAQPALRDDDGTIWLPAPGRPGMYADSRDLSERSYIERNYGPVSEVSS